MSADNQPPPDSNAQPGMPALPPLHRAAKMGDHAEIRRLIADGADVNAVFDIREDPGCSPVLATALMVAAASSEGANIETVELLLQLGADPHQTPAGRSAAEFACQGLFWGWASGGDAVRLKRLLEAGSPLRLQGEAGGRVIADTARSGDPDRLKILLDLGADSNPQWKPDPAEEASHKRDGLPYVAAPYSHEIPLFQAVESGSIECVQLLLQAGADPRQKDNFGRTSVFYADSAEMLRVLLATGLSLEDGNILGWPPLVDALMEDPETARRRVRALIAAGADVNASHDRGYTVFMSAVASSERDPEVMQILVDAGADPHAVTELGYNAWHAAIDVNGQANAEESVRATFGLLKRLGVDMERKNKSGETPLARAINSGTAVEVQVLLELSADPSVMARSFSACCDLAGAPALFMAVGRPDVLERLLQRGADPNPRNGDGLTPLAYAVNLLIEAQAGEPGNADSHDRWITKLQRSIVLLEQAGGVR